MNKEEKKAVENIKALKILFEIADKKDFEATPLVQREIAKDLKTLLNLIDKMKNCINILDDELKERNKTINEKEMIIEKLQKENEELKADNYELNNRITDLLENIPIQKIKDKIEELQKEYNKLDKQVDEYIKSVEKDVSTYYENKERISIMQTLSYFIGILQELIEEREENNG